jgi:hypothetical protein
MKKHRGAQKLRNARKYFQFLQTLEPKNLFSFTITAVPDTQHMVWRANDQAVTEAQWIVSQKAAQNIQFVVGLGDIVNDGASDPSEWVNAKEAWDVIATMGVPFGAAQGNHDHDNWAGHPFPISGTNTYNTYFGPSSPYFNAKPWYGSMTASNGLYDSKGTNSWQKFTADGQTFLNICLEDEPSDAAFAWADSVLAANPGIPTIIATHQVINQNNGYLGLSYHNGGTTNAAPDTPSPGNAGVEISNWAALHDDQIFMILCGHASGGVLANGWAAGNGRLTRTGANGNTMWIIESDYQENTAGPNGPTQFDGGAMWVRMYTFDLTNRTMRARTYSPGWNAYSSELPTLYPNVPGAATPFNEAVSESDFTLNFSTGMPQIPSTALPSVTIAATGSPSEAGPTNGTFTLTRTGNITGGLVVNVSMSGTAANGADYTNIPNTVSFTAGQATKTVTLAPIADAVSEPTETATMSLLVGSGYITGAQSSATLNITNAGGGVPTSYDGFNYTVGNGSNLAGQNTGTGLSAPWTVSNTTNVNVLSGSLSYSANGRTLATSANKVSATGYGSATGTLSGSLGVDGNTAWVGFEFAAQNPTGAIMGDLNLNPTVPGTGLRFGAPVGGTIGGRISVGTYGGYINTGITAVANQTYFIVASIQYLASGDVINLYVNPTPGVIPTTPTATKTLPSTVDLPVTNTFHLYSPQGSVATFDEVRIGTSYLSVAPEAALPLPAAPSGTTVTATSNSLNVNWVDNSGTVETGFRVWRSTNSTSGFAIVQNLGANVTSWPDTSATPGTTYFYKVTAFNANGDSAFSNTASGVVPALATVTLSATDTTAAEDGATGPSTGTYTVTRTGSTSSPLTVNYTIGGTALNTTDYNTITTSVTIPAGSASATINITPKRDDVLESTETVILTLAAGTGYTAGSPSVGTVNIADNGLILYEGFNYTPGTGTNWNGQSGGAGWASAWTVSNTTNSGIVAGSMPYAVGVNALKTSGNQAWLHISNNAQRTANYTLGQDGTSLWIAFEMNQQITGGPGSNFSGIQLSSDGTNNLQLGSPWNGFYGGQAYIGGTRYYWTGQGGPTPVATADNTPVFLVYRLDFGAGTTGDSVKLWVNPTPGLLPTDASANTTWNLSTKFVFTDNVIRLRQSSYWNKTTYDEIRLGNNYYAVAPDPIIVPAKSYGASSKPASPILPSSRNSQATVSDRKVFPSGFLNATNKLPEFSSILSNVRRVAPSTLPMVTPSLIVRSVIGESFEFEAPLAGAWRPDRSADSSDDAELLGDEAASDEMMSDETEE